MPRCASFWLLLAGLQAALAQDLLTLALPDLYGQSHTLQQWHGKVILLNFWAAWCGPCLTEISHLADYQRRYGQKGLQVVGIGLDQPTKLANVVRALKVPYPVLQAPPRKSGRTVVPVGRSVGGASLHCGHRAQRHPPLSPCRRARRSAYPGTHSALKTSQKSRQEASDFSRGRNGD